MPAGAKWPDNALHHTMLDLLHTILSFIVALGILIAVHEFGHFWVARRCNVKVLRFSIGFGQPLWRKVGKTDNTEYVIAAIPLGGYVKMLDEREEEVDESEAHRAFNRQSLSKRAAIVAAGPIFNFIFAIAAYWLIFVVGDTGLKPILDKVEEGSVAASAGLLPGDEFLAINDKKTRTVEDFAYRLINENLDQPRLDVRVLGVDGVERDLQLDLTGREEELRSGSITKTLGIKLLRPSLPARIGETLEGSPAQQAGLMAGDLVLSYDGVDVVDWRDWVMAVRERPNKNISVMVERDGAELQLTLTPKSVEDNGKTIGQIGATVMVDPEFVQSYQVEVSYGPLESLNRAMLQTWDTSVSMLKMLGKIITGQASVKNLSGPISIADYAGKSASYGWIQFVKFLAVISISLGVLNLLPIPVLDGGHLFFYAIEAIKGSPLSESMQLAAQKVGITVLLMVMGLAFYLDLGRVFGS